MSPSKLPPKEAGAHAPALVCFRIRLFLLSAWIGAAAWFTSTAIGEHLAEMRLQRLTAGLPRIETLSRHIAATLHQQGVCLNAPAQEALAKTRTPLRIEPLRTLLTVQGPCLDLAIAQQQFETLQIETATIQLIHQKQMLTVGLVTDSLRYRAHSRHHRRLQKLNR